MATLRNAIKSEITKSSLPYPSPKLNMRIENKVVVVTGGSSGMGRALCVLAAKKGAKAVISCDVNETDLQETKRMVLAANPACKVHTAKVDVSNRDMVNAWRDDVLREFGHIDMLFNNAGINCVARLLPTGEPDYDANANEKLWDKVFAVDFFGVLYCTRAFLPSMAERKQECYIVNTASVNAFWTWPNHSSYTAAKHAVKGYTEALMIDCRLQAPHIKVACLFPGGVKTGIAKSTLHANENAANRRELLGKVFERLADLSSEDAADWILWAVENDQSHVLVGYDALVLDKMVRLAPTKVYSFYDALGRLGVSGDILQHETKLNLGPLNVLRFLLFSGVWYTGVFLAMIPFFQLRRSWPGKLTIAAALLGLARGVQFGYSKL